MKDFSEIGDDQIRIIGENSTPRPRRSKWWIIILSIIGVVAIVAVLYLLFSYNRSNNNRTELEDAYYEPLVVKEVVVPKRLGSEVDSLTPGFTEICDTTVNDIPLRIYIPHNAEMSLHIGRVDRNDTTIIYTAQAADIRADNGGIVGAFVLQGTPKAWGLSKKGYCASINGKVTIGVADNSPLFEEATEKEGYFFRQYPLVKDGRVVENELKGKSTRRAICDRMGEIFMIESGTAESLHDFAQALSDMNVDQAIYLVGSSAYGWAVDKAGVMHEFGEDNYYKGRRRMPRNTNYIVWRRK